MWVHDSKMKKMYGGEPWSVRERGRKRERGHPSGKGTLQRVLKWVPNTSKEVKKLTGSCDEDGSLITLSGAGRVQTLTRVGLLYFRRMTYLSLRNRLNFPTSFIFSWAVYRQLVGGWREQHIYVTSHMKYKLLNKMQSFKKKYTLQEPFIFTI